MKKPIKPLSADVLAQMYTQLARLEKSGIPTEQALSLLSQAKNPGGLRAKIALNHLKRGKPLATAGIQAGLFVGIEGELIKLADASGTHEVVYSQLAQVYTEKATALKKMKSQLIYPAILFILAIFLHPLPALFGAHINLYEYLWATVGLLVQIALLIFVLLRLPRWSKHGILSWFGLGQVVEYWQMRSPYFGKWYIRKAMRDFFQALGLMLQAGLPILDALPKAYKVVDNTKLQQQLQIISQRLKLGDMLTEALEYVEDLPALVLPLINAGEHAGSLADSILRYTSAETAEISLHQRQLAAWIPRLIYLMVVIWIAYHIIVGGSELTPKLPEEL